LCIPDDSAGSSGACVEADLQVGRPD
jgi:hypothetical protein